MENSPISDLPGPIPPDKGPESSPNEVLTAKLQAQNLQLKTLTTQINQLQHTIQQLASLLTLKNGKSTNSNGIAGINTPNSGNLEANPQIFSANTATAPPNPPGNLILGDGIESIAWYSNPVTAYKTLENSYSVAPEISRDSLYREPRPKFFEI
ncbi:hypothetical protein MCOR03_011811 [Pyricularia oryzae]|nr:hypothetical protein MCOR03_011811 [Pyricularia oryzae]